MQILRVGDLVRGDHERPRRREAVERLAARPLRFGVLDVARGDVVDHGVAPDVRERVLGRDILRGRADDHAELGLVVDGLAERSRPGRRGVVARSSEFGHSTKTVGVESVFSPSSLEWAA